MSDIYLLNCEVAQRTKMFREQQPPQYLLAGIAQAYPSTNTYDSEACYTKMKNNIACADQTQSKI